MGEMGSGSGDGDAVKHFGSPHSILGHRVS